MRFLLCSALLLTLGCDKAEKAPEAAPSATPREVKAVGPKATVDLWAPALTASLGSLAPSTAAAEP